MKVLIIGLPYFSTYIQEKLSNFYPEHTFISLNTYYSRKDRLKYLFHLCNADVVYSINGVTHNSKTVDWALKLKKRIVFHWVGSDLLLAKEAFNKDQINDSYIQNTIHLSDSPWYVDELEKINIKADFAPLNAYNFKNEILDQKPNKFSVLTYIKQGKEQFYGIDIIIELAQRFPEIDFRIAGMSDYSVELPSNISLLGWVDNMKQEIEKSWVCIRMPKHDGLSFFVIESLAKKRYVIYNQAFEASTFAQNADDAADIINELLIKFKSGTLQLNESGSEYIANRFSEEQVLSSIYMYLSETHE